MRFLLHIFLGAVAILVLTDAAWTQMPRADGWTPAPGKAERKPVEAAQQSPAFAALPAQPQATSVGDSTTERGGKDSSRTPETTVAFLESDLKSLESELAAARAGAQKDEKLAKRVELLQKQIEVQQKMIQLLLDHVKKQPMAGTPLEKLQIQVATLEARSQQAAQRDSDVAQAIDNLTEHIDAEERNGPRLPARLKELFLGSGTNESPLSINGQFLERYTQFNGRPGQFSTPDFAPYFLLKLNEQFLLTANLDFTNGSTVSISEAQIDWLATDWLTVVLGRYLAQIGFFNERLNHEWINKLPDVPLMFRQVSPLPSIDGVMLRGATYLGCTPIKVEYSLYGGNGLRAAAVPTTVSAVADLEGITGGPDEQDVKALGGRVGLWVPEWGLTGGISAYFNGRYSSAASDQFNLWQLDFGYRQGNWDVRFEYANTYQQAASYIGNNIRRQGYYAQVAYRPRHLEHCILKNLEVVGRYSRVWFHGIDPTLIDPTAFATLVDVPVNRDQYTVGLNYYFYPSMILRLAYEVNHEFGNVNLHDNVFLGQFVWAF
jgi:hypothetical protein